MVIVRIVSYGKIEPSIINIFLLCSFGLPIGCHLQFLWRMYKVHFYNCSSSVCLFNHNQLTQWLKWRCYITDIVDLHQHQLCHSPVNYIQQLTEAMMSKAQFFCICLLSCEYMPGRCMLMNWGGGDLTLRTLFCIAVEYAEVASSMLHGMLPNENPRLI